MCGLGDSLEVHACRKRGNDKKETLSTQRETKKFALYLFSGTYCSRGWEVDPLFPQ